ncbi:MAG: GntR family transcriptional regulator, N-acetylglucosamine utilization regulator [Candidatus Atribacteria bacterium]|nr:GntR family transcriptional regulator, N-acetylglucosamine utilization regulator [Candidatus Atribacteria bacterium]
MDEKGDFLPKPEEISEENNLPLYQQLKNILKGQILNGTFRVGDQIPSESELCARYGVSRITVRQAIASLVQEGLLYRRPGKGTFVTSPKLRRRLPRLYSFSEDMRELGLEPSSRTLEQKVEEAEEEVAELLKLPDTDRRVTKLVRVRLANGEPILIERTFVPHYLCPDLVKENLEQGSLYDILRKKYRLWLDHASETYEVTALTREEAEALNCPEKSLAFFIERVSFLKTGVPVELTRSVSRGDRVRFTVQLVADQAQIRRQIELEED